VFMSPRLASKFGLVSTIVATQAASTVFMVFIPLSPTFGISATLYLVRVFLMNLSNPLTQSMIMGLVVPEERGMASGIASALWRLPNALTVSVGYYFIQGGMLALPFDLATVLYLVGIGSYWAMFRKTRLPEESPSAHLGGTGAPVREDEDRMVRGEEVVHR